MLDSQGQYQVAVFQGLVVFTWQWGLGPSSQPTGTVTGKSNNTFHQQAVSTQRPGSFSVPIAGWLGYLWPMLFSHRQIWIQWRSTLVWVPWTDTESFQQELRHREWDAVVELWALCSGSGAAELRIATLIHFCQVPIFSTLALFLLEKNKLQKKKKKCQKPTWRIVSSPFLSSMDFVK